MNLHETWMRKAIDVARGNPSAPFGAILVDVTTDRLIVEGINQATDNPILHGELDAIQRYAETGLRRWSDLRLYTTAEPCCMCQAAILWAGIPEVVFGTSITTLAEFGWNQLRCSAADVVQLASFAECKVSGGVLSSVCDELFRAAQKRRG